MEILFQHFDILIFLFLVCLGYGAGSFVEKRHYRFIHERESAFLTLPAITAEEGFELENIEQAEMVSGNVVISIDYFKRLLAILRNMFGGRVKSYETLVDRARREALLRMKEEAGKLQADIIVNTRLETAAIGYSANKKRQVGSVEVIAYGTAIRYAKS